VTGALVEPGTSVSAVRVKAPNGSERLYAEAAYTVVAAGALLGWKRSAAHKHAKNGTLPTVLLDGRRVVTASAMDRLLHPADYAEQPGEPEPVEIFEAAEPEPVYTAEPEGQPETLHTPEPETDVWPDGLDADGYPVAPTYAGAFQKNPELQYEEWYGGEVLQPEAHTSRPATPAEVAEWEGEGGTVLSTGLTVGPVIYY
jgi:hypothetical protein